MRFFHSVFRSEPTSTKHISFVIYGSGDEQKVPVLHTAHVPPIQSFGSSSTLIRIYLPFLGPEFDLHWQYEPIHKHFFTLILIPDLIEQIFSIKTLKM